MKNKTTKKELFELLKQKMVRGNSLKSLDEELMKFYYSVIGKRMKNLGFHSLIDDLISFRLIHPIDEDRIKKWLPNVKYNRKDDSSIYLLATAKEIKRKFPNIPYPMLRYDIIDKLTEGIGSRKIPVHEGLQEFFKLYKNDELDYGDVVLCWLEEESKIGEEIAMFLTKDNRGKYEIKFDFPYLYSFLNKRDPGEGRVISKILYRLL